MRGADLYPYREKQYQIGQIEKRMVERRTEYVSRFSVEPALGHPEGKEGDESRIREGLENIVRGRKGGGKRRGEGRRCRRGRFLNCLKGKPEHEFFDNRQYYYYLIYR